MNQIEPMDTSSREIVTNRLLNARRELVYEVWTNPKHVAHWWGPTGFKNTIHEMDVRPGGVWRFMMHGPNGVDYPNKIVFEKVEKHSRLVFLHGDDVEGGKQFHVTVTFEDFGEKTNVKMRILFNTAEEREKVVKEYGALEGNKQTMDRLEAYLSEIQNQKIEP
jgi:uncharacterized protein YndB with AHSA1/START domain